MIEVPEQIAAVGVFVIVALFSVAYLFCGVQTAAVMTVISVGLGYLAKTLERGVAISKNRTANGQNPNPLKPKDS